MFGIFIRIQDNMNEKQNPKVFVDIAQNLFNIKQCIN